MDTVTLKGKFVQLTAVEPQELAQAFQRWNQDSEYQRFSLVDPAALLSPEKITEWAGKRLESDQHHYFFAIRLLGSDHMVGSCGLSGEIFPHGEAYVGIGIGDRELWGKGYGTDAMLVLLRYGFNELNLRRVTLTVSAYNPRGIRSYEKAGFVIEGKARDFFLREGRRWDMVFMGILREEWLGRNQK